MPRLNPFQVYSDKPNKGATDAFKKFTRVPFFRSDTGCRTK